MIKLESYKGFDICYENIFPPDPTYKAKITCKDNKGEFKLLCSINPEFQPVLTRDEVSKLEANIEYVLRTGGSEKVKEKIDLQEFRYDEEYYIELEAVDLRRFLQGIQDNTPVYG